MQLRRGQEIEVEVDRLALEGRGVGRLDDFVIFVDGALPGEHVRARILQVKRRYAQARVAEVLRPGAQRVAGRCGHLHECGGCSWQEFSYAGQLAAKEQLVREALERLGGLSGIPVQTIVPSPDIFFYRNKMEFSFFVGSDDPIVLGLHSRGTFDRVFDLRACYLMSETANAIVERVRQLAVRSGLPAYHNGHHSGFWRFLVIRDAKSTGQTMVNLVTNEGVLPNPHDIVSVLTSEFPTLTSLVRSVSTRRAAIAVGEREEVLHGVPEIEEQVGGLRFRITANSFFQTNTRQAERLFAETVEFAALQGNEEVLDLYAGTGAISLFLAQRCKRVTGIELVAEAVEAAERNAALNGIRNCRFVAGEVRDFFRTRAAEAAAAQVVVADPPRAGLHPDIVRALRLLQPRRIVYVSCNPSTLARDLQLLCSDGLYVPQRVQPIDMFPHTYHVETVVALERGH